MSIHAMAEQSQPLVRTWDRAKLAAIPVLAVALIYVVRTNGTSDESTSPDAPTLVSDGTESSRSPGSASPQPAREWPNLPLSEILAHNPFSMPEELVPNPHSSSVVDAAIPSDASPAISPRKQILEELSELEVTAYYKSENGAVAILGDRLIREGDLLEEVVRVIAIRPDGVVLALDSE